MSEKGKIVFENESETFIEAPKEKRSVSIGANQMTNENFQVGGNWTDECSKCGESYCPSVEVHVCEKRISEKVISERLETGFCPYCEATERENQRLKAQSEWREIKSDADLPTDNNIYWVTWRNFDGKLHLGKGSRDGDAWEVGEGHKIYFEYLKIVAVMPYVVPAPFQPVEPTPCPNCKETSEPCRCMRNRCMRCGGAVGNITFTVCDDCWDIKPGKPESSANLFEREKTDIFS